jgi:LCT (Lysosomal Cystine Transporter) family transporter
MTKWHFCVVVLAACLALSRGLQLLVEPNQQNLAEGESTYFTLRLSEPAGEVELLINVSEIHPNVVSVPSSIEVSSNATRLEVLAPNAGQAELSFVEAGGYNVTISNLDELFLHVFVVHSRGLNVFNSVIGWVYFVAWSISFYPQIIYNFRRKSVVGLNFDFLAYNLLGFSVYSAYNIGLYWVGPVRQEYFNRHPGQLIPVQLNDVIFSIHATIITTFTIGQCFFLERGTQRVSWFARAFIAVSLALIFSLAVVAGKAGNGFSWLQFLYYIAYIKLVQLHQVYSSSIYELQTTEHSGVVDWKRIARFHWRLSQYPTSGSCKLQWRGLALSVC